MEFDDYYVLLPDKTIFFGDEPEVLKCLAIVYGDIVQAHRAGPSEEPLQGEIETDGKNLFESVASYRFTSNESADRPDADAAQG